MSQMTNEKAIDLLKNLDGMIEDNQGHDYDEAFKMAIQALQGQKHGKWEWELADNGWKDIFCSECGWTKNVDIHVYLGYNFCPYCGADMRGEV